MIMINEKLFTKEDLEEAFNKGMSHDFRPSFFPSFNKWFNLRHLNLIKKSHLPNEKFSCDTCKYNEYSKRNAKKCKACVEFGLYG